MDRYIYLLISTLFLAILCICILQRKDLIRFCIKTGLLGGFAGLISEVFYFRDYWRPPTLLGIAKISPEDFIFGFAVTALSAVLYPVLFKKIFVKSTDTKSTKSLLLGMLIFGFLGIVVLNLLLKINSIFVTSGIFLAFSFSIWIKRKDLIIPSLHSAFILSGIAFVIYVCLLVIASPHYAEKYWLLSGKPAGAAVLGSIPITELLWYFSWGMLAGILYPFVKRAKFESMKATMVSEPVSQ